MHSTRRLAPCLSDGLNQGHPVGDSGNREHDPRDQKMINVPSRP